MKIRRNIIITIIATAAIAVSARTLQDTLLNRVSNADVIVVATATSEPQRGELFYTMGVYEGEHRWWEVPEASPEETTNALAVLVRVRDTLVSSTNLYASNLVNLEIFRHQYLWETTFTVSEILMGHANTNITVINGTPYTQDKPDKLKKGKGYILFLKQKYSDVDVLDEFVLPSTYLAIPVEKKYEWSRWAEQWNASTNWLTHTEFLGKIRAMAREHKRIQRMQKAEDNELPEDIVTNVPNLQQ